jgi:hypothetical protein
MSSRRQPSAFRQGDIAKLVRAVARAGLHITGVKFGPRGEIEVVTGCEAKQGEPGSAVNEWDEGLRNDKSST